MSALRVFGAVEIGTSTVKVMIGEVSRQPPVALNIIGVAQGPSEGIRKGAVVDFRAAKEITHQVLAKAETSAGVQLEDVFLALTGRHLEGFRLAGSATVSSSDGRVRQADIDRALRDGKRKELPPGRIYIHHVRNHFRLDGHLEPNPLGREGSRLEASYWNIHAEEKQVRDLIHIVNGYGLNVEDLIVSSVASAAVVVPREAKQNGSLLVDIGGGTTDWAVFQDGLAAQTGVVAVGADHLRNDLALGLRIHSGHAHRLLHEYGKAVATDADLGEHLWVVGDQAIGDRRLPRGSLIKIVNLRLDELFEVIRKQLGPLADPGCLSGGIYLTGGVARLPGLAEVASARFGVPAIIGVNPGWVRSDVRGPEFSTVLGLLHFASRKDQPADATPTSLLRKVTRLFSN